MGESCCVWFGFLVGVAIDVVYCKVGVSDMRLEVPSESEHVTTIIAPQIHSGDTAVGREVSKRSCENRSISCFLVIAWI